MNPTDREIVRAIHRLAGCVPQKEIASQAGCSIATVSRSLARLRDSGIVDPSNFGGGVAHSYTINYAALPEPLKSELTPHG